MAEDRDDMTAREYILCDCHTPYHGILIEHDPDVAGAFTVSVVSTKPCHFWHRVKYALRHVFGLEALVLADLIINRDEAKRLTDFLSPPNH